MPHTDGYVGERSISFPQLDEPSGLFYRDYLGRSDPLDPGEAAYAIKVAEQCLSRDNAVRAREFFETARQLLDHEKMLFQWRERRDPEGYHRGRAEVEAALIVVLSRLVMLDPNPLYVGQFETERSLFRSDHRALEDLLAQSVPPPSNQ